MNLLTLHGILVLLASSSVDSCMLGLVAHAIGNAIYMGRSIEGKFVDHTFRLCSSN